MNRHPQELTDGLTRQAPRVVKLVEGRHGRKLVDVLGRRSLPECQVVIADLVRELGTVGWTVTRIAEALESPRQPIERTLREAREQRS